ncbi:glycoside hydrolase family 127 protein [Tahibacter soli]|uniref:Glycoside hydrolase family 127 protein n=1 Tax=Tahibacter soli TaxID=2983605 RepID=A0A9X3YNG7_9GAMM|nr:glycoside hydrolase family 127 protein [Tahibacter soli]MDC8014974.1 glycoside hydrolase family 127 protein [Tahibacter soli]
MSARVELRGVLGDALAANLAGRLTHFIEGPASPAIALFDAVHRDANREGDWYGEHAGKWLCAAAKAVARSNDATLRANLAAVADHLVALQGDDGYLGTYAPERRFMQRQPPKPGTWDGAPSVRTWDVWVHAYLVLGLVETHRTLGDARYLDAARRIGDLALATLRGGIDVCDLGNHHGLSATVLLDAAMELHAATREARWLDLATLVLEQADRCRDLQLLTKLVAGADAADIATGKAYQLLWNLVGLTKLSRATGNREVLDAIENLWHGVREHHLTLGGGPWGGVAHRSREVFNAPGAFSPQGYVETCSTLAWIQLNRELLKTTGKARYAEEIERSAYNDLLAAQAPDGQDWCYYVFPNGRRVHTTYWRCCKSSGAMALEELPAIAYDVDERDVVSVNLIGASRATLALADGTGITLEQFTEYPFDGRVQLRVAPERPARFVLRVRIPAWADDAHAYVDGERIGGEAPGEWLVLDRQWRECDVVALTLPMTPRWHRRANRNVQESRAPDGSAVRQTVLDDRYAAIVRGPLVYATGLVDGYKTQETIRAPDDAALRVEPRDGGAPAVVYESDDRTPLVFEPYYAAGGRTHGAWRLTWLALAPQPPEDDA